MVTTVYTPPAVLPYRSQGRYEPETNTFLAALTGTYSVGDELAINNVFMRFKNRGSPTSGYLYDQMDRFAFWALCNNEHDALLDWKDPVGHAAFTKQHDPAKADPIFTAKSSWAFLASEINYIDTGFNASTEVGAKYTQFTCHFLIGCLTAGQTIATVDNGGAAGASNAGVVARSTSDTTIVRSNNGTNDSVASTNGAQLVGFNRRADNDWDIVRGEALTNKTRATTALPTTTFKIGSRNGIGSTFSSDCFFVGGKLDADQRLTVARLVKTVRAMRGL